jgi:hypothetical protein
VSPLVRQFRDFFVSLKLTVVLLALSILLIFWATLAQVQLGIWGVQQKFFHAFFVLEKLPGTAIPVPVFPGGYIIGGLLLINLIAAHIYRFKFEWRKLGIQLTHLGLILLLVGELVSGIMQVESSMRLEEGGSSRYSESYRLNELVLLDTTNADYDEVVAIPEGRLSDGGTIQHPKLPFQLRIRDYFPNATIQRREQVPNASPAVANAGIGPMLAVIPLPITYKQDERNAPAAHVEVLAPEGSQGIWLASPILGVPQTFSYQGRTWQIALRFKRYYHPFELTLHDFTHDVYPGTQIPKNFSSRVQLKSDDGRENREVLIYMNNPLRYAGLTFYQASFEQGDKVSILQVVRNPGWLMPYIACILMSVGLVVQFGLHLFGFVQKRTKAAGN